MANYTRRIHNFCATENTADEAPAGNGLWLVVVSFFSSGRNERGDHMETSFKALS